MNVFVVIAIAMVLIIIALRKKIPIGPSILGGGLLIWALVKPEPVLLGTAVQQTLTMPRTYDLLFALYFVVCLEIELRKSGCLKGMVSYLNHLIHSTKVTLAVMPAKRISSMPVRATGGSVSLKNTTLMISAKGMTAN